MENLEQFADSSAYKVWIQVGLVALAVGWFLAGWGKAFDDVKLMNTLGNFFRLPGGVLLTTGLTMAGIKGDDLSTGIRVTAIICAGILGTITLGL